MSIYINEPLVQPPLPAFYNFMGGLNGFIKNVNALNKLTIQPRHWRGTKIAVAYKPSSFYDHDVQATVYQDGILVYCSHTNQELEQVGYNAGLDDEYSRELSVCQKCGAGWNKDGELLMEGNV